MTLREEFEILRGEPIEVFEGDPMDIPCIETSDADKLCNHPVVSVNMITYNHETYIRQAIEGVMMQKTDFEFELVIGEDCSKDKTREICFEYQKKYPDKIRVLWWHENVSKFGGNSKRVIAHCRGEYMAFCEGDDYWVDPLKLQKQVNVMRMFPNVGLCYTDGRFLYPDGTVGKRKRHSEEIGMPMGLIRGKDFCKLAILGKNPYRCWREGSGTMTATTLLRMSCLRRLDMEYDVMKWRPRLGDLRLWIGMGSLMDVYFLPDDAARYRITRSGAMGLQGQGVHYDGCLLRLYFFERVFGLDLDELPPSSCRDIILEGYKTLSSKCIRGRELTYRERMGILGKILGCKAFRRIWWRKEGFVVTIFCALNMVGPLPLWLIKKMMSVTRRIPIPRPGKRVLALYSNPN